MIYSELIIVASIVVSIGLFGASCQIGFLVSYWMERRVRDDSRD